MTIPLLQSESGSDDDDVDDDDDTDEDADQDEDDECVGDEEHPADATDLKSAPWPTSVFVSSATAQMPWILSQLDGLRV